MHNNTLSGLLRTLRDQRCMLLFLALVLLLVALPFLTDTPSGQTILILVNATVLLTAVAAVGRTWLSLLVAILLVVLILASAFFSSSETAMMTLNRYRLKHLAERGHRAAQFGQSARTRIGVPFPCPTLSGFFTANAP